MKFRRRLTYKDFKRYFQNNMQEKDKHDFEKSMMQDAFEEEAYDGLSQLSEHEMEQDVEELKRGIAEKAGERKRFVPDWFRYAATVLLLVGIGIGYYVLDDPFKREQVIQQPVADSADREEDQASAGRVSEPQPSETDESMDEGEAGVVAEEPEKPEKGESGAKSEELQIADNDIQIEDHMVERDPETSRESKALRLEETSADEETAVEIAAAPEEEQVDEALQGKTAGVETMDEFEFSEEASDRILVTETASTATTDRPGIRTIKGKVVSASDSSPLPGVSVYSEKDPNIGTVTDMEGTFTLNMPEGDRYDSLKASFVGFGSGEVTVGQDTNILVMLEPDAREMSEVVVVGYDASDKDKIQRFFSGGKTGPKPPNGWEMNRYREEILERIDYTALAGFPGEHKVKFGFTLDESGSLNKFHFRSYPDSVFVREIKQTVKALGPWIPANKDGENVPSTVKMKLEIVVE